MLVALSVPVDSRPEGGRAPDHAPDAMQPVASDADQDREDVPPAVTAVGSALRLIVGAAPPLPGGSSPF